MADKLFKVSGRDVVLKYKDMNDGTHAEVVSATAGGGGGGGDASAENQTAGNAILATIDTAVDAANVTLTAIDAAVDAMSAKLPASPGIKTTADSLSVAPASDAIFRTGAPRSATQPVVMEVTTNATGTNWQAFGAQACTSLDLVNTMVASTTPTTVAAATNLRWRYVGTSLWMPLPANTSFLVMGITDANQIEVQRSDNSNTQIGLRAVAYP